VIGELVSLARLGYAAVSGVDALVTSLTRMGLHLALRSRALDRQAAEDIVERARARVPQDTGRLFSGIEATEVDGVWGVQASAVNPRDPRELDYAFLVEHGTRPGIRGERVADAAYFRPRDPDGALAVNPRTGRRYRRADANRRARRTHPGTPPHPYFWPSVNEVMAERGLAADALINEAANREGLT
jgi:hypothetical protein